MSRSIRFVTSALTILLVPHLAQVASAARCDPTGSDAAAIATARAQVEETCGCASAATHGDYVACSAGVLTARVHAEQLPASCKRVAQRCAARSTCGRTGAVACCKTSAAGLTKASIKKSAAACRAPEGGSACASGHASVCDACDADGCAPVCGDGTVEPGEGCEPPGGAFCDDSCQLLPGCGNGVVEAGEDCEPPGAEFCDDSCQRIPGCGNEFVDPGEECDSVGELDEFCPTFMCGTPSEKLACQCCGRGDDVPAAFETPTCCDGTPCRRYKPNFCTCDPNSCAPLHFVCHSVPCCPGLTCGPSDVCQ